MSQITRCPQCQTRFKVVDDQLRISDGWVRCGKCKSVFDALTHLVARSTPDAVADAKPPMGATVPAVAPVVASAPVAASVVQAAQAPVAPSSVISRPPPMVSVLESAAPAAAVTVTENSVAIDPHGNVPELSVLVFPRRAGFGDSGYVDSSWMSAYESDVAEPVPAPVPQAPIVEAASVLGKAYDRRTTSTSSPSRDRALESEWSETNDLRPDGLRSGAVGFSAQDDLAELQAREGRLLEAIAEKKSKSETKVVALEQAGVSASALPAKAVLQPAPAPEKDEPAASSRFDQKKSLTPDYQASVAPEKEAKNTQRDDILPESVAQNVLYAESALAGRTVEPGKVESALDEPRNYVAEIDDAAAANHAPESEAVVDEPSFVRDAKRKAFWSQPSVVVLTLLSAVLLLAGLLFQIAVAQRDQLAVQHPQLRPALAQVCKLAGCQLALPRDLQRVSIDSTSFNPIGARQFKLTVVLRNAADYAVAMPALELSLNDAAEKLVLRRVLTAIDMKAPAELPARGEWTAVVSMQVAEPRQDVVGYRVLAFYP